MLNSFLDKFVFTNGLRYTHYNFFLMNVPFALAPVDVLAGLASIQNSAVNRVIYAEVKKQVSASLVRSFQLSGPLDKAVGFVEEFFSASGWGLVKHVDLDADAKRAILVVEENPVARIVQGNALKPVDHVFRGAWAGVFSSLFQADVDCIETQCLALGHNRCEFVVQPIHAFDFSKPEPREQLVVNE